jgi:hypothetical protein
MPGNPDTFAFWYYIPAPVTIVGLQYFPNDANETDLVGIYDNSGTTGYPTTLLASAAVTVGPSGGLTNVPLTPFYLSAPQTIWMAWATSPGSSIFSTQVCINNTSGIGRSCILTYDGGGQLPNPWNWGSHYTGDQMILATPDMAVSWICP